MTKDNYFLVEACDVCRLKEATRIIRLPIKRDLYFASCVSYYPSKPDFYTETKPVCSGCFNKLLYERNT